MEAADCVVIGGGPAGLTAALYLGRYRRNVLVVDGGASRAALIPVSHNLAGFPDGMPGPELLERMRTHATRYGARLEQGRIMRITPDKGGFTLDLMGGQIAAATVVLATGVVDLEPALPDLPDAIHRGLIRHCPICDGYEVTGQRIAVIGFGAAAVTEALFIRNWSADVTLLTLGHPLELDDDQKRRLNQTGIKVVGDPVAHVDQEDGRIAAVRTAGGGRLHFDTLYSALGACVRSDLAVALGAEHTCGALHTDDHQETTIPNLFAAGDVTSALNQVAVATAQAAVAATTIHRRLMGLS